MRNTLFIFLFATSALGAPNFSSLMKAIPTLDGHACSEKVLFFDYGDDGGMRNWYCRLIKHTQLDSLIGEKNMFKSGPHMGGFRFDAENDFGHYNPKFVRWFGENALVKNTPLTQLIYDQHLRKLARLYYAVNLKMQSNPKWVTREAAQMNALIRKGKSVTGSKWGYSSFMGKNGFHDDSGSDWGGFNPSLQRSAVFFWLRRTLDGTQALWMDNLRKGLEHYDGGWLKQPKKKTPQRR